MTERKYDVTICEVLKRTVQVQAKSEDEARQIVERQYYDQAHVLNADDFKEVDFTASKSRAPRSHER